MSTFDPLTGEILNRLPRYTVFPKTHYVTPQDRLLAVIDEIKVELQDRLKVLTKANKLVEAQRLEQRTQFDLEMIQSLATVQGLRTTLDIYQEGRKSRLRLCLTIFPTMPC